MKKRKKLIIKIAGILIGIVLIFIVARYSWRLFGFSMCNDDKWIEILDMREDKISFKVTNNLHSIPGSFIGYKAEQKGDTLYIGVKFNTLLGVLPKDKGTGYFTVPIDGEVNKIIRKGSKETIIWERDGEVILHMMVSDVDAQMLGYSCYYGESLITGGDFAFENPDFLLQISRFCIYHWG